MVPRSVSSLRFQDAMKGFRDDGECDEFRFHVLHHDRDRLSERRAAHRPCLRGDRDRRAGAFPAVERQGCLLSDRNRRARPEDDSDRAERKAHPDGARDAQRGALQGDGPAAEHLVRSLHSHLRACASHVEPGDLGADGQGRRYLSRQLRRLVFGSR